MYLTFLLGFGKPVPPKGMNFWIKSKRPVTTPPLPSFWNFPVLIFCTFSGYSIILEGTGIPLWDQYDDIIMGQTNPDCKHEHVNVD